MGVGWGVGCVGGGGAFWTTSKSKFWARFLSLSQTCLRTVLDSNNLLSFLAETIWFSVAVLATRS